MQSFHTHTDGAMIDHLHGWQMHKSYWISDTTTFEDFVGNFKGLMNLCEICYSNDYCFEYNLGKLLPLFCNFAFTFFSVSKIVVLQQNKCKLLQWTSGWGKHSRWKVNKKIFWVKSQQKDIPCEKSTKKHFMWKVYKKISQFWKVNKKAFHVKSQQKDYPGETSTNRYARWRINKNTFQVKSHNKSISCEKST